jgi:hypothetical protein
VKVITLQAKDSQGQNIPHLFNGKELRLSKSYGFSGIYDLYMFPQDTLLYTFAGRTSPLTGLQAPGVAQIYEFNIGDVFHYSGSSSVFDAPPHAPSYTWIEIWNVVDKDSTGMPANVTYSFHRCRVLRTISSYMDPDQFNYTESDTLATYQLSQLQGNPVFSSSPDEFIPGTYNKAPLFYLKSSEYNNRITRGDRTLYSNYYNADCWEYWNYPGTEYIEYTSGLGLTHRHHSSDYDWKYNQELVYYKKGNEVYGTPVATNCEELMPYLSVAEDTIFLAYTDGDCNDLSVLANYTWIINPINPCVGWLSADVTGGTGNADVTFCTLTTNEDPAPRICNCSVVIPPALEVPFVVIQKGKPSAVAENIADVLNIFPNPTTGLIHINSPEKITRVEVVSPSGITLRTIDCNGREVTADLSGNPQGLYILRIKSECGVVCRKVNLVR